MPGSEYKKGDADSSNLRREAALKLLSLLLPLKPDDSISILEAATSFARKFSEEQTTRALWPGTIFGRIDPSEITIQRLLEAAQHQLADTPDQQVHWQRTILILNGALALEQKRELAAT